MTHYQSAASSLFTPGRSSLTAILGLRAVVIHRERWVIEQSDGGNHGTGETVSHNGG